MFLLCCGNHISKNEPIIDIYSFKTTLQMFFFWVILRFILIQKMTLEHNGHSSYASLSQSEKPVISSFNKKYASKMHSLEIVIPDLI